MSSNSRSRQAATLPGWRHYSVRALLASGALYYALDLSQSDRGAVDYGVITLIVLAIVWNVVQLARRILAAGASRPSTRD